MLCYEIDWMWNMKVYQTLKKKLREWGYTTDSVRVWNYFNEDEAYPLVVDRADDCASLTLAKKDAGEAIVAEREANGPYTGFLDFCLRLAGRGLQPEAGREGARAQAGLEGLRLRDREAGGAGARGRAV